MVRISLQNNNKNAGKRAVGVSNILAGVVAITIMGTGLIMSGCGFQRVAEATDTPVATQTANPTATPTLKPTEAPTPKPSPTNTPMPELTEEQKELLLGINNKFNSLKVGSIDIFCFELNSKKFIIWTYSTHSTRNGSYDYFSVFNGEYLFTDSLPKGKDISSEDLYKYIISFSPKLEGLKFIGSCPLSSIPYCFKKWNIKYDGNETIDKFYENSRDMSLPDEVFRNDLQTVLNSDKIKLLYLDTTPQEEIPPFWMYIEGATIPDELKGIYTTPTIAPTAFRDGNASVRYLMGERDLDTEMENKTKRM